MIKYFLSIACILNIAGALQAQTLLPTSIKGLSPALLPDSSIMIFSHKNGVVRYVHENDEWSSSPDELTKQVNALTIGDESFLHFRFSNDFSRIVVRRDQPEGYSFFENVKENGQWGYFKEILPDRPNTFCIPSFSMDNSKLYVNDSDNSCQIYNDGNLYETSTELVLDEMKYVQDVIGLGNNSILIHATKKKQKDSYVFFSKQLPNGQWSAPLALFKGNNNLMGLATTGFDDLLIYTDIADADALPVVHLMESPAVVRDELQSARRQFRKNTISQEIVSNAGSTNSGERSIKPTGKYYALLIGNADYQLDDLDLSKPVEDALKLKDILIKDYVFDSTNVITLLNANRNQIIEALYKLRGTLTSNDNLLIFYAGHGYWDKDVLQGYWWPTNAVPDNPSNWLSNSDLREQISGINTAHTLLISDACFSGGIFKMRGAEEIRKAGMDIIQLYKMRSRRAITSGTMSSVPDQSVFFRYLIKYLEENQEQFISSSHLFTDIRRAVLNNSLTVPQDGVIMNTGDEGGDFIFIRK